MSNDDGGAALTFEFLPDGSGGIITVHPEDVTLPQLRVHVSRAWFEQIGDGIVHWLLESSTAGTIRT